VRPLVDECCDPRLVAALRQAGHDVSYALESDRGASDEDLVAVSIEQDRILITEDEDFGELAIRHGKPLPGLILLRIAPENRRRKPARVLALRKTRGPAGGQLRRRGRDQRAASTHFDDPVTRNDRRNTGPNPAYPPGAPWVLTYSA
jgi:predicted nuclease of predicted toxin-antitoxin system